MTDIRVIGTADHVSWDQYVFGHVAAGPYLATPWKRAIEFGYGHPTFYLGAFARGSVSGVLPLVLVRAPLTRGCLVSLPYCDYGGLLADDSDVAAALLDRAIDLAQQLGVGLEIRTTERNPVLGQRSDFAQITNKCRMVLGLPGTAAALWGGFKSKLRSQVNSAMKRGLTHRFGREELLPDFYRVFSRNMRDLGSPVHAFRWLCSVLDAFGCDAQVGVVYHGTTPAAAGIVLVQGREVAVPWVSSLRALNRLNPNMLLYWKFLEYAADRGFERFDFGRSTPGEGTFVFKSQWGAQPAPLFWCRYRGRIAQRPVDSENGAWRRLAETIWKRLPLGVANAAGPAIRKYISR